MEKFELGSAAAAMLLAAGSMALYEWTRAKAGRPIFAGHQAVALYWIAYLSLLVLGVTTALAAIVR
jgi:hypothetical protein